jgi:hypothetical protein
MSIYAFQTLPLLKQLFAFTKKLEVTVLFLKRPHSKTRKQGKYSNFDLKSLQIFTNNCIQALTRER